MKIDTVSIRPDDQAKVDQSYYGLLPEIKIIRAGTDKEAIDLAVLKFKAIYPDEDSDAYTFSVDYCE